MNLQIIQNEKGMPSGVFIPIKQWNELKKQYKDLEILENKEPYKEQVIKELKQAIVELKLIEQGKMKSRPIKKLLDEL